MSGKELIKIMIKDGWVLERINGSHHVMKKGNQTEIIPVHRNKDSKRQTYRYIYSENIK